MYKRLLLIAVLLFGSGPVYAECTGTSPTWTAANPTLAEVNNCMTLATTGDTINVPTGTATWNSALSFNKSVNLIGAGWDNTVITGSGTLVTISSGLDNFRISGFRFNGGSGDIMLIGSSGGSLMTGFRIDHNWLSGGSSRGMYINATITNSVIDHNRLWSQTGTPLMWGMSNDSSSWTSGVTFGSNDFLFVEDNDFQKLNAANNNHAIMANGGGPRMVVRYNTLEDGPGGRWADVIDMHGCCPSNTDRGARAWEIYENRITRNYSSSDTCCSAFQIRGGSGVLYNNVIDVSAHTYNNIIAFREYRINPATANRVNGCRGTRHTTSTGCPTSASGEGYACCDQIGRGTDIPLSTDPTGTQESDPVYVWGNTKQDNSAVNPTVWSGQGDYIQVNRDYYNSEKPGYTAYTYPHPLQGVASADTTPSAFHFTDVTGATPSNPVPYQSDNATVLAIDNTTTISISGADCEYLINTGSWKSTSDNVVLNDNVAVRTLASTLYNTAKNCTLNMGGTTDVFSVTTEAAGEVSTSPLPPRLRGVWNGNRR